MNVASRSILAVLQVDRITRFMNPLSETTILIYVYNLANAPEYMDDFCTSFSFLL